MHVQLILSSWEFFCGIWVKEIHMLHLVDILVSNILDQKRNTFVDIEQELCNTEHHGIPNVQKQKDL